ncbi:MAG: class I SAM-dependent methyltransferase [Actinomycetota bacterium]|nr:class I SAM-dependent methyltransferase [Actinomycetota bacterium]
MRGAGENLPLRNGAVGAVVMVATLCFATDPARLLAEAARVLWPGGRLVLGLVPLDSAWGRSYAQRGRSGHPFYRHARFLTLEDHRRLLVATGLQVVDGRSTLFQSPDDAPTAEPLRHGLLGGAGFVGIAATRDDAEDPDTSAHDWDLA